VVTFLKTLLISVILCLVHLFVHSVCCRLSNFDLHRAYVDFFIVLCSDDGNWAVFYFVGIFIGAHGGTLA
jgi:hypothetical protein